MRDTRASLVAVLAIALGGIFVSHAPAARAQFVGGGSVSGGGGGGGSFSGGAVSSGIELDETYTLCSDPLALSWDTDENTGLQRSAADEVTMCLGGQNNVKHGANRTDFYDSTGTIDGSIYRDASVSIFAILNTSLGGLFLSSTTAALGSQGNRTAYQSAAVFSDSMTSGASGTAQQTIYGEGLRSVNRQQSITVADNGGGTAPTDTTAPTSEHVEVTCNDTDGCTYQPGETSVPDGSQATVCNMSANTVTISDSAGIVEARGTVALAQNECADCTYTGAIWSCR